MAGRYRKFYWNVRALVVVGLAILWSLCPAIAGSETEGKAAVQRLVSLFSEWHGEDAAPDVFKKAASVIDYDEMSEKALGARWGKLSPAERSEFVATFRGLIEERYYKRWHRIFNRAQLTYQAESSDNGDLLIKTLMTVGSKQDNVVWRLSDRSGSVKVISIAVNQKDLLNRLSMRLEQRLRKDDFKGVLTWMRQETVVEDDEDQRIKSHRPTKMLLGETAPLH